MIKGEMMQAAQSDHFELDRGRERDLLLLFLAIKLGLLLMALLSTQLLPFNWELYNANMTWGLGDLTEALKPLNTWDTQHYLLLAHQGYGTNPMSNAFFPLYPALIRIVALLLGSELAAAWLAANVVSLLVPVYMYRLGRLFADEETAFRSTALLLTFPTAFYLSSAYSEALFLSLCLMAFYYLAKKQTLIASVFLILLPLARAQGALMVFPLGAMAIEYALTATAPKLSQRFLAALRLFGPPIALTGVGVLGYFAFCQWQLGDFRAGLNAQSLFIANNSLLNIFRLDQWFARNFTDISFTVHGYTTSIVDRVAFVFGLLLMPFVYAKVPRYLFCYAVVMFFVPALSGNFMSFTRHLLLVFPIFYTLAQLFGRRWWFLCAPFFALQALLFAMHLGSYWVA